MGIFKSLFGRHEEKEQENKKVFSQKELKESRQCLGMDFLLGKKNLGCITEMKELGYTEEYAYVSAVINDRPAGILIYSVMYPRDFNEYISENIGEITKTAEIIFDCERTDIYAVGVGLVEGRDKNVGIGAFRIRDEYYPAVGCLH